MLALITGASGGIGMELARLFAADGHDLLLVARRQERLDSLKTELEAAHGVAVTALAVDLSETGAAQAVFSFARERSLRVDALVNNAGFGDWGFFAESDLPKQRRMIELNVTALTELSRLFLPEMIERGSGRVLNVASVASFMPGAKMSVYYATKAFVRSFSEALSVELKKSETGVTVTALCPGPVRTDFWETAEAGKSRLLKYFLFTDAKSVARYGYNAMKKGRAVALPGFLVRAGVALVKILPGAWVRSAIYSIQK